MFSSIAIVGAGAVGSYYGARLARGGANVRFLMRRDLAHVRAHGLRVTLPDSEFTLRPVPAFGRSEEIGPVDLVVIGLKATANSRLEKLVPPLVHPATAILNLQNGLGVDEQIAQKFGAERVMGGLCFICLNRTAPGEITCRLPGSIAIGEFQGPPTDRARSVVALFEKGGVKASLAENLDETRWRKLVWNVPFNGLAIAAGGATTDRIIDDPALRAEARGLMEEIIAAAAKFGHVILPEFIDRQFELTAQMGPYQPSSLIDWREGREVEVEAIWGEPLRRARAAGAATPRLAHLYAQLKRLT